MHQIWENCFPTSDTVSSYHSLCKFFKECSLSPVAIIKTTYKWNDNYRKTTWWNHIKCNKHGVAMVSIAEFLKGLPEKEYIFKSSWGSKKMFNVLFKKIQFF